MKRKAKRVIPKSSKYQSTRAENVKCDDGFGTSMPPEFNVVYIYFDQKGVADIVLEFFEECQLAKWKTLTGYPITNWKVCAAEWIFNYRQELKRKLRMSPFYSESS